MSVKFVFCALGLYRYEIIGPNSVKGLNSLQACNYNINKIYISVNGAQRNKKPKQFIPRSPYWERIKNFIINIIRRYKSR